MSALQASREGQDAMVKLLQQGIPDVVVRVTCCDTYYVFDF
jgi:hypothetical protein